MIELKIEKSDGGHNARMEMNNTDLEEIAYAVHVLLEPITNEEVKEMIFEMSMCIQSKSDMKATYTPKKLIRAMEKFKGEKDG